MTTIRYVAVSDKSDDLLDRLEAIAVALEANNDTDRRGWLIQKALIREQRVLRALIAERMQTKRRKRT